MRDCVELDSTSPAVLPPNQGGSPVRPTSPSRPNFSYLGRTPPAGVPMQVPARGYVQGNHHQHQQHQQRGYGRQQGYQGPDVPRPPRPGQGQGQYGATGSQRGSTLANLKTAAAAGIHGAGETLRGTLNATADRRFGHVSPATHAKSEDVINAGCAEIQTGRFAHQHEYRPRRKQLHRRQ